jgi:hypothetical protein
VGSQKYLAESVSGEKSARRKHLVLYGRWCQQRWQRFHQQQQQQQRSSNSQQQLRLFGAAASA